MLDLDGGDFGGDCLVEVPLLNDVLVDGDGLDLFGESGERLNGFLDFDVHFFLGYARSTSLSTSEKSEPWDPWELFFLPIFNNRILYSNHIIL